MLVTRRLRALHGTPERRNERGGPTAPASTPVPVAEDLKQPVPGFRIDAILGQCAGEANRRPHLLEVSGAVLAVLEVSLEPLPIGRRQCPFQITRHDFDELLAG